MSGSTWFQKSDGAPPPIPAASLPPNDRELSSAVAELMERVARLEAVAQPMPNQATGSENVTSTDPVRTERLTLEIDLDDAGQRVLGLIREMLWRSSSVRVVKEFGNALPGVVESQAQEIERLDRRVAELDLALKSAPAANAGGESKQEPRGWLTAEERKTLGVVVIGLRAAAAITKSDAARAKLTKQADDVDALLARSTPPRVKVPEFVAVEDWHTRDRKWAAAIREAGIEVADA